MKKIFTLVAAALTAATFTANAEVLLTEDFNFPAGTAMYNTNGWLHYSLGTGFDIMTVDDALTLDGYRSTPVGSAVNITGENGEDIVKAFSSTNVTSGTIYISALVKVTEVGIKSYFMSMIPSNGSNTIADKIATTEYGRLGATKGSTDNTFKFYIARGSATVTTLTEEEFNVGEVYQIVYSYTFDATATKNDLVQLWVNPKTNEEACEPTLVHKDTSSSDATKLMGIELRQAGVTSGKGNTVVIDALRVANTWEDAFKTEPVTAVADLNVEKVNSVRKYVENGQVVIENNGIKYNIAGQVIK